MPLKFAANISMLFQEIPLMVNRFKAAKDAGFKYVECTFPYSEGTEELGQAREEAGVEHVLVNGWPGKHYRISSVIRQILPKQFKKSTSVL